MKIFSLSKILFIVFIAVFVFVGWFVWAVLTDEPPQFFPLNNLEARYTVIRDSQVGQGWVKNESTNSSGLLGSRYYIEYRGDGVFADDQNNNFFRVTVGNSKVDLEPFRGKDVTVTKGKFVSSSTQCIVDKCIDISGPFVVLNIDELQLIK